MAHFFSQRKIIIIFVTIGSQQTTHERVVKTEQNLKAKKVVVVLFLNSYFLFLSF